MNTKPSALPQTTSLLECFARAVVKLALTCQKTPPWSILPFSSSAGDTLIPVWLVHSRVCTAVFHLHRAYVYKLDTVFLYCPRH